MGIRPIQKRFVKWKDKIIFILCLLFLTGVAEAKDRLDIVKDLKGQDKKEIALVNKDMPKFMEQLKAYSDRLKNQAELNADVEESEYLIGLANEVDEAIDELNEVLIWTGERVHTN